MKRGHQVAHDSGKKTVTERQQPRRSKREHPEHTDKYADQRELVTHHNGEEADRG